MSSMNLAAISAVYDWQKQTGESVLTYRQPQQQPAVEPESLAAKPEEAAPPATSFQASAGSPKRTVHAAFSGLTVEAPLSARPPLRVDTAVTAEQVIREALPFNNYVGHPSEIFEALALDPALKIVAAQHLKDGTYPKDDSYWHDTMPNILKASPPKAPDASPRKRRALGD